MNNFHGGPGGPFPGPGFGPGFGPAPGPGFGPAPGGVPLEVESQFMYGEVVMNTEFHLIYYLLKNFLVLDFFLDLRLD